MKIEPSMSSVPGRPLVNMPFGLEPNWVAAQNSDLMTLVTCSSSWSTALCKTFIHGFELSSYCGVSKSGCSFGSCSPLRARSSARRTADAVGRASGCCVEGGGAGYAGAAMRPSVMYSSGRPRETQYATTRRKWDMRR